VRDLNTLIHNGQPLTAILANGRGLREQCRLEGWRQPYPLTDLRAADLRSARLAGLDLSRCNLREADLTGADLTGADLSQSVLDRATLRSARLVNADLERASLWGADLLDTDLTGTGVARIQLSGREVTIVPGWDDHADFMRVRVGCDERSAHEWRRLRLDQIDALGPGALVFAAAHRPWLLALAKQLQQEAAAGQAARQSARLLGSTRPPADAAEPAPPDTPAVNSADQEAQP